MKYKLKSFITIGAIVMTITFSFLSYDSVVNRNLEPLTELPFEH